MNLKDTVNMPEDLGKTLQNILNDPFLEESIEINKVNLTEDKSLETNHYSHTLIDNTVLESVLLLENNYENTLKDNILSAEQSLLYLPSHNSLYLCFIVFFIKDMVHILEINSQYSLFLTRAEYIKNQSKALEEIIHKMKIFLQIQLQVTYKKNPLLTHNLFPLKNENLWEIYKSKAPKKQLLSLHSVEDIFEYNQKVITKLISNSLFFIAKED